MPTTAKTYTVKDLEKALGKEGKIIRRKLRAKGHGVGFGTKYEWSSETDYKRILASLLPKPTAPPAAKNEEEKKKEPVAA